MSTTPLSESTGTPPPGDQRNAKLRHAGLISDIGKMVSGMTDDELEGLLVAAEHIVLGDFRKNKWRNEKN